jgi:protein-disulfide isomerase
MAKRRRERKSRIKQRERRQQLIIIGTLASIVLVFVAVVVYNIVTAPPGVSDARLEQEAVIGQPNATVRIVEYGAYGCPGCRSFHQSGDVENIVNTYPNVEFRFRNLPIISANDKRGAEAAQCALDQSDEDFWVMHDAIYDLSQDEFLGYDDGDFASLAGEVGLDAEAMRTCLDERTHERTVNYWENEGRSDGIASTPTIFVNNVPLADPSTLEAAVNQALQSEG